MKIYLEFHVIRISQLKNYDEILSKHNIILLPLPYKEYEVAKASCWNKRYMLSQTLVSRLYC